MEVRAANIAFYGFMVAQTTPAKLTSTYWAKAKTKNGWRVEFAERLGGQSVADTIGNLTGMDMDSAEVNYLDPKSGHYRLAWFADNELQCALYIAPEPVAVSRAWAVEQLAAGFETPLSGHQLMLVARARICPTPARLFVVAFLWAPTRSPMR